MAPLVLLDHLPVVIIKVICQCRYRFDDNPEIEVKGIIIQHCRLSKVFKTIEKISGKYGRRTTTVFSFQDRPGVFGVYSGFSGAHVFLH